MPQKLKLQQGHSRKAIFLPLGCFMSFPTHKHSRPCARHSRSTFDKRPRGAEPDIPPRSCPLGACPCYRRGSDNLYPRSKTSSRRKFTFLCRHTRTRAPPPLRTKAKDETTKPLMGNVILLLAAHPSVLFQAPDHSHNWDSDLWLTLGTRPSRTSGCHT